MKTHIKNLSEEALEDYRDGEKPLGEDEIRPYLEQLPGWDIDRKNEINRLTKRFSFRNFKQAMKFANDIGELAESFNHHPKLIVEWGRVSVYWWTHAVRGLHKNDFIMAGKTEKRYSEL